MLAAEVAASAASARRQVMQFQCSFLKVCIPRPLMSTQDTGRGIRIVSGALLKSFALIRASNTLRGGRQSSALISKPQARSAYGARLPPPTPTGGLRALEEARRKVGVPCASPPKAV